MSYEETSGQVTGTVMTRVRPFCLPVAVVAVTIIAPSVNATPTYQTVKNDKIIYRLKCANGQNVSGMSSDDGSANCSDGSNSLTWDIPILFGDINVEANDSKNLNANHNLTVGGVLDGDGTQFHLSGNYVSDGDFFTEIAVLTVSEFVGLDGPRSVNQLIDDGFITASDVVFVVDFSSATDTIIEEWVDLGAVFTLDEITLHSFSTPEPTTLSLLALGGLMLAGHRRRTRRV